MIPRPWILEVRQNDGAWREVAALPTRHDAVTVRARLKALTGQALAANSHTREYRIRNQGPTPAPQQLVPAAGRVPITTPRRQLPKALTPGLDLQALLDSWSEK